MAEDDDDMQEHTAGDAGAPLTYPAEAGSIKKNDMIIMKGDKPCKVRMRQQFCGGSPPPRPHVAQN